MRCGFCRKTRLGQPTKLGSWTILARDFARRVSYCAPARIGCHALSAPPGQRWLITNLVVTNASGEANTFDSHVIAANYSGEGSSSEVHAQRNTETSVAPYGTLHLQLAFRIPEWSRIYSLVVRKDLGAEKQARAAVEIDLNCC